MADAQANINVNINTSQALSQIRMLQKQISMFHSSLSRGNAAAVGESLGLQRNLVNAINSTGQFSARMGTVATSTERFTTALEKNKLSMGQYFRYAGGASKTFGKMFGKESDLIQRTAIERVKTLQTQYVNMGRDANGAMRSIAVRPLALDMKNLGTQTAIAAQKQMMFNQLIRQGSTNLLNWGKNTQWAGRQLMVGFTIPLGIMASLAIKEFQKLEEQAIKFRRVYGDMFTTEAETERALKNVRDLANEFTKYGIAVEETVGLAAKVAQMGNMGAALEQQVTQATRLSVLGGISQEEALDTTISLTNAFGIAASDLADKINLLNAAENQTILSIEDFNTAIPKAGSVVKQLGGDVGDLAILLTAMREGGINASEGANALKTSLGRLVNPSRQAREDLSALGINVVGIVEKNAGNLMQTIVDLAFALENLAPLERSRAIERLFGKFQFARMSTLLQNITDEGSQANKVLQLTAESSERLAILAERELGRVEESSATKFKKTVETFQAALAPLGEQFLKVITPIVEFFTKLLDKFNNLGEGGKQAVTTIIAVLGLVAPIVVMTIGLFANALANTSKFIQMTVNGLTNIANFGRGAAASTQYLTTEQLEALAAANTLGSAHDKLSTSFNVERIALQNLIATYKAAVTAQAGLATGAGAAAVASGARATGMAAAAGSRGYSALSSSALIIPRRFATGTLSVPGPKGAGDVVPSLLSPGEAVIPAKAAKKYMPFIKGMIAGNLPGFVTGGIVGEHYQFNRDDGSVIGKVRISGGEATAKEIDRMLAAANKVPEIKPSIAAAIIEQAKNGEVTASTLKNVRKNADFAPIFPTKDYIPRGRGNTGLVAAHATDKVKFTSEQNLRALAALATDSAKDGQESSRAKILKVAEKVAAGGKGSVVGTSNLVYGLPAIGNTNQMTGLEMASHIRQNPNDFTKFLTDTYNIPENDPAMVALRKEFGAAVGKMGNRIVTDKMIYSMNPEILKKAVFDNPEVSAGVKNAFSDALKIRNLRIGKKGKVSLDPNFASGKTITIGSGDTQQKVTLGGKYINDSKEEVTSRPYNKARDDEYKKPKELRTYEQASARADNTQRNIALARMGMQTPTISPPIAGEAPLTPLPNLAEKTPAEREKLVRRESSAQVKAGQTVGTKYGSAFVFGATKDIDKFPQEFLKAGGWRSPNATIVGAGGPDGEAYREKFIRGATGQTSGSATSASSLVVSGTRVGSVSSLAPPPPPPPPAPETATTRREVLRTLKIIGERALSKTVTPLLNRGVPNQTFYSDYTGKLLYQNDAQGRRLNIKTGTPLRSGGSRGQERIAAAQPTKEEARQAKAAAKAAAAAKAGKTPPVTPGAMGAGMGLSMVGSAAVIGMSMQENKTGDWARENMGWLLALSAAPMLVPLLKNPIILFAAIVGAGVAAFMAFNSMMEKAKENGQKLSKAMSMSADKVQSISEFTGTVSATELSNRKRKDLLADSDERRRFFGQSFLESDPGKVMLDDVALMKEKKMTSSEIGQVMGNNLTSAILQGVLSTDQAFSVAAALGENLGDYSIPAKIVGQIVSLVGPSGENLETDAIQISVRLQEETVDAQKEYNKNAERLMDQNFEEAQDMIISWETGLMVAGGIIATLGGLALSFTGIATPVGVGVTSAGLAMMGTGFGFSVANEKTGLSYLDRMKENEELRNASIGLGIEALSQSQQTLDIIDQQYYAELRKLDLLEEEAETEEELLAIEQQRKYLSDQRSAGIKRSIETNQNLVDNLMAQESMLAPGKFSEGLKTALDKRYEGDIGLAFYQDAFNEAEILRKESQKTGDEEGRVFALRIQAELAAGNLSYGTVYKILEAYGNDEEFDTTFNLLMKTVGSANASMVIDLLDRLGISPDQYDIYINYVVNSDDFDRTALAISALANIGPQFDLPITVDTEDIEEMEAGLEALEQYPDVITKEIAAEAPEGSALKLFYDNWEELMGSADSVDKTALVRFQALISAGDRDLIMWWRTQQGLPVFDINLRKGRGVVDVEGAKQSGEYNSGIIARYGKAGASFTPGTEVDETPIEDTGSGSKTAGSILDPIVKASRDFGNLAQNITLGWEASLDAILKMVDGTSWGLNGLANQLRRIDVPETLIEKFLGQDPEEWEKAKRDLFVVDASSGAIIGTTDAGKRVIEAQSQSIIAEEINSVQSQIATTEDQINAFDRLVSSGADVAVAYEIIQNKALATAIATAKTTEQVKRLIEVQRELKELEKEIQEINKEDQRRQKISDAVEEMNRKFKEQTAAMKKMREEGSKYTDAQIRAIFQNQDLLALFLEPKINPKALAEALKNAEKQAKLELEIKKLTLEGQEDIFRTGLQAAMSAFNAKETEIEINLKAKIKDDQSLIKDAERQIANIQFELDGYQAGLEEISMREEEINRSYEKRFEALNRIAEANDMIVRSQQQQLNVADALSRGDIAAAARAAQEMKAQQSEDAIENQRKMLEIAQRTEVGRLRASNGMTREELEKRIRELEEETFNIEQNSLRFARERIRLAEIESQDRIEMLEVLGMTREEWERIENQVSLAEASGWRFADAMREALGIVESLISSFINRPEALSVDEPAKKKKKKKSSAPAPASAPAQPTKPSNTFTPVTPSNFPSSGNNSPMWASPKPPKFTGSGNSSTMWGPSAPPKYTQPLKNAMGGQVKGYPMGGLIPYKAMGGQIKGYPMGGLIPYKAVGGMFRSLGSDTVPAMLTPGEFVIRRPAVRAFGVDKLEEINRGTYAGNSMYNYNLSVNVRSDSNPEQIARTVMSGIKQIEGRRIRGNRYNG